VTEMGCGLSRFLRHRPVASLDPFHAADVNSEVLDRCRPNLPGVAYHHHGPLPPIASLPPATFDIIYAQSVFTHIPLE